MSLRRTFIAVCAVVVSGAAVTIEAASWTRGSPTSSASQATPADNGPGVKKDGSQLTVVGEDLDRNVPLVDVATNSKLKKKPPSFWSRLAHPTQWFSSSKKK